MKLYVLVCARNCVCVVFCCLWLLTGGYYLIILVTEAWLTECKLHLSHALTYLTLICSSGQQKHTHVRMCVFVGITVQWRNSPSVHGEQSSYHYLNVFWCDSTMFFQTQFTHRIIWSSSKKSRSEENTQKDIKTIIWMNNPWLQYAAS